MRIIKTFVLFLLLSTGLTGVARQVTDTLTSHEGDRVILTYDLEEKDGTIEIRFIIVNKRLSTDHSEKYGYDLSYIKVVCFDRDNRLKDINITAKGLNPKQYRIPKGLIYIPTNDDKGYSFLDEGESIRFDSRLTEPTILSIPIFLAHYKKRFHYELFAQCGNLEITIGQQKTVTQPSQVSPIQDNPGSKAIDMPEEPDSEMLSDIESKALADAQYVMEQLGKKQPDFESLKSDLSGLGKEKHQIQNKEIKTKIEETEQAYEQAYNNYLESLQKEKSRLDSINRAEQLQMQMIEEEKAEQKAEQEKRQKIWMIVGGVLLAVLMFVGNQVMQNIRNKKMEKKQQDAMKKAQEALQQQQQQANGEIPDPTPKRYTI